MKKRAGFWGVVAVTSDLAMVGFREAECSANLPRCEVLAGNATDVTTVEEIVEETAR